MCPDRNTRPVYSSDQGRLCPDCGQPVKQCRCKSRQPPPKVDGTVRVGRETKGRKGAGVTTVSGVPLTGAELKTLAGELKKLCGSGGTLKDGVIEIQGEHRDKLVAALQKKGWTVKRAGG